MNIYITQNGQQLGPFTLIQVRDMVKAGTATLADFTWYEGLPNWVPLSQVPGMNDPALAAVEGPRERPVLVWVICLFFFICLPLGLVSSAISPALISASKVELPAPQQQYFDSLGLLNYYIPQFVNFGLALVWTIQFFRLKKNSIYFLLASLGLSVVLIFVNIFTTNWLEILTMPALVVIAIAWILNLLTLYYNWHLMRTKVLR